MNNEHKARALKVVLASLQAAGNDVSEAHAKSALAVVQTVVNDKTPPAANESLSPIDIAALILQVLQIILARLPNSSTPGPAAPKAIDGTAIVTLAETIIQILELLMASLPKAGSMRATSATALSPVDIAQLILELLQLVLSKIGTGSGTGTGTGSTPAPAPAPVPAPKA